MWVDNHNISIDSSRRKRKCRGEPLMNPAPIDLTTDIMGDELIFKYSDYDRCPLLEIGDLSIIRGKGYEGQ